MPGHRDDGGDGGNGRDAVLKALEQGILERLAAVRQRIADACARAGRDPDSVTLIGVTKTHPPEVVEAAVRCGLLDLGENYAQELVSKAARLPPGVEPRWHFIGHLQTNKVRLVSGLVRSVHSVDRLSLVEELARRVPKTGTTLDIYVEVAIAGEAQKSGAPPDQVEAICRRVLEVQGLHLSGLMCVPPLCDDKEASRPYFKALRDLRDHLIRTIRPPAGCLGGLSMGMSHDLDVAVEEGATVVRVGTALFGPRG